MRILALETATEACSAAIYDDGRVCERYRVAPREHTRLILPMMDEVLAEAGLALSQLDALAFGRGPGAFTGVRIATGVVQGVAFGADLPVVPVSTLAALSQSVAEEAEDAVVLAAIDARMGEVYWGQFAIVDGLAAPLAAECVVAPEAVSVPGGEGPRIAVGSGWGAHGEALAGRVGTPVARHPERLPRAAAVARLAARDRAAGVAVPAEAALPIYLRDDVARRKGGR